MNKIKIIKKVKAYIIRLRMHRIFGFLANLLIYTGYLLKLSKWVEDNKSKFKYDDFYNSNVVHKDREQLYKRYLDDNNLATLQINYLEFGVGHGNSLKWWTEHNMHEKSIFWAFDTYEGLPEKYGSYDKGKFSLGGNFPNIEDDRINFIKGLFQDTLLSTIPKIDFQSKTIIHIDGDLYSSAIFTLRRPNPPPR